MRAIRNILRLLVLLPGLAGKIMAADCPQTFPAADAGWYNAANFHDPENNNFITGWHAAGATELRNFFVFDLPVLLGPVTGAQLRLYTFTYLSPQTSETYELRHVATPVTTLVAGAGPELTNVFHDLGDGTIYGTRVITNAQANSFVTIPLNADALAAINAASGQRFALGGRVSTLAAAPGVDEKLFAFSSGDAPYVELTLTFAGTNAPFFYLQPPAFVSTNSGSPVTFTVGACGAEPLRYRWYFDGVPLNQTNSTLVLGSPHAGSSGTYFAVVSNAFGAVTSTPVTLVVDGFAPQIFNLPAVQEVAAGFPVAFSPFASGNPPPALQWYFAGLEIPGATNLYYLLPSAQPFHTATFSLVATNLFGAVTNDVLLRVEPLLLSSPGDDFVAAGEPAYLPVHVASSVPVTYQWRQNGTNLPGANGRVLTIPATPPGTNGPYDVVVANSFGARTSAVARVVGEIGDPPVIAGTPLLAYVPEPGRDTFLRAQAVGAHPLRWQWFRNDQPLAGATNVDLLLANFSTNDSGTYHYTATNGFGGAASPVVNLQPVPGGPSIVPFNTSRDTFAGRTVTLRASVQGAPPPRLQWQRGGTNLPGATNAALLFASVTSADQGFYVLTASNASGTASAGFSLNVQPARALDRWTWRHTRPQANDLLAASGGGGRLVAGGEGGSLVTSTNGVDWLVTALGQEWETRRVVFGQGRFVALVSGVFDGELLFVSTNGTDWRPQVLPLAQAYALDFANGEFLVTGYGGSGPLRLLRSTDAQNWTSQTVPAPPAGAQGLPHGQGHYLLAIMNEMLVSPDLMNWERHALPFYPNRVAFGGGQFVASDHVGEVWTSPDGRVWSARNLGIPAPITGGNDSFLNSLAAGPGQFITVGDNGLIARSANGINWTTANSTTGRDLHDVTHDGAQWLVSGNDGVLLTSPDGVTWTDRRAGRTRDLYGIIYTNHQFVAVGYEGTVLTSPDAVNWTVRVSNTSHDLHAVTYANGLYVAGGRVGTIITSPDAVNWTVRPTPTTNYIERLAWGAGRLVAAATHGAILSSTNGFTWTQHAHPGPPDTEFEGVVFGEGRFVMVGVFNNGSAHSIMLVSSNGADWVETSVDVGKGLRGVAHDGQRFLAVGNDGVVIFSEDGLAWGTPQYVTPFRNWRHARAALGRFIIVGNNGALASRDTIGWRPHATVVSQNFHDLAYGAGRIVAVGNAGAIVQSDFAVPLLSTPRFANGAASFQITGGIEEQYRIESTLFFNFWQTVGTYTNDGNSVTFTNAGNPFQGFYRTVNP